MVDESKKSIRPLYIKYYVRPKESNVWKTAISMNFISHGFNTLGKFVPFRTLSRSPTIIGFSHLRNKLCLRIKS